MENLLSVLDGDHPPTGETVAIATAIHLIDNRGVDITAAQKIAVQGMTGTRLHGQRRGHQGLTQHLPTEDLRITDVTTFAAKQVELEPLERQQANQVSKEFIHP